MIINSANNRIIRNIHVLQYRNYYSMSHKQYNMLLQWVHFPILDIT